MILSTSYAKVFLCVTALCFALAGCAGRKAVEKPDSAGATEDPLAIKEATVESPEAHAQDASGKVTIYFDFDSSEIRSEFRDVLLQQVAIIVSNPQLTVRLEGHTDSRGSREYNIGLGERRAQAVRRFLTLNGASQAQVATLSYGEERPEIQGDSDYAWRMNRRVEIVAASR